MNTQLQIDLIATTASNLSRSVDHPTLLTTFAQGPDNDRIDEDGAEIDNDDDDSLYEEDDKPMDAEDDFGDEDAPSEEEDEDEFDDIIAAGDEAEDNFHNGEVPSIIEEFELEDAENDEIG